MSEETSKEDRLLDVVSFSFLIPLEVDFSFVLSSDGCPWKPWAKGKEEGLGLELEQGEPGDQQVFLENSS